MKKNKTLPQIYMDGNKVMNLGKNGKYECLNIKGISPVKVKDIKEALNKLELLENCQ